MFRSIKGKIIVITLIPLLVTLLTIGLFAVANKSETENDLTRNRLSTYRTLLESGDLSFESLKDANRLEILLNEKVHYAAILKKNNETLYALDTIVPTERNEIVALFVADAFDGIETTDTIVEDGESMLIFVTPLIVDDKIVAVLRIDLAREQTVARIQRFSVLMLGIVSVSLFVCYLLINILLSGTILRGILKLKEATSLIESGDLDTPVTYKSEDELGELAQSLDTMRTEILHAHTKLQTVNKDLETQVQDRTAALKQNLEELERLNEFMVDREMKMIELKQELAKLKEEKE